jgi:hypothetical protein
MDVGYLLGYEPCNERFGGIVAIGERWLSTQSGLFANKGLSLFT